MGLEPHAALSALLDHRYQLVRLAALWNRKGPAPDGFDPSPLDWQVEAAERSGKQVILAFGKLCQSVRASCHWRVGAGI